MQKLSRQYAVTLRKYLRKRNEATLAEAYELGRGAIHRGLGVLEMARVQGEVLADLCRRLEARKDRGRVLRAAESFFLEALSPFEATHRGFRDINSRLQQLIITLEKRNKDLGAVNTRLGLEIKERKRAEDALRGLSTQIMQVQEEERKRLSRELHDEVGQMLMAVSVNLASTQHNGSGHKIPAGTIAGTQRLLQEAMDTVHHFARELRPALLDELGLLPALRSHIKGFAARTGLQVRLRANPLAEQLGDEQKTALFRIAQESLTNVAKHARATRVALVVRKAGDGICLEVADNGKSFRENPQTSAKRRQRLGLLGMQERVRLVHGRFNIRPKPGKGTTVQVVIPFRPPEAETRPGQPQPRKP